MKIETKAQPLARVLTTEELLRAAGGHTIVSSGGVLCRVTGGIVAAGNAAPA